MLSILSVRRRSSKQSVRALARLIAAAGVLGIGSICLAQATKTASEHPDSLIDIYGGYAYFHPVNSGVDGKQFKDLFNPNATVSVTGWFNHFIGLQMEGAYFSGNGEHTFAGPCTGATCNQLLYTIEAGPTLRFPLGSFVPFIHTLGGGVRMNGPALQQLMWGWGVTGGGGFDYIVPIFNKRLAIRPIQADFQYSQVVYGPLVLPSGTTGGFGEIDAIKFSSGIIFRIGQAPDREPVQLGCSAEPTHVYPGDVVHVTGSTLGINPKNQLHWSWQTNGGKIIPSGGTATIDTTNMAPGEYTVAGHVAQGLRARDQAGCTTPFTVKPFDPPTLSCSATPSTVTSGTTVDISTVGTSPQNRPLTYSYSTTTGQISANGPTAKLLTPGLGAATITVTCNATDDLGKSATATTTVVVTPPPVPVIAQTQPLCAISFERDRRRPARVDNEAKGCLDDIALTMNQHTDDKLVMIGNTSPEERPEAAAERALNAKQYMTDAKGIDPARIEVRIGTNVGRTMNNILVPAGTTFSDANTELFDEHTILRHGNAYGRKQAGGIQAPTPAGKKKSSHSSKSSAPSN
jgi:hypothetical protein